MHCSTLCDLQTPFTVAQMRKFADKLRNFSMTPSPDSQQLSGGPRRRHSILSASAVATPASATSTAADSRKLKPSWIAPSDSPAFAPQRLLSQFGGSPQVASTAKKSHAGQKQQQQGAVTAAGQLIVLVLAFSVILSLLVSGLKAKVN